MMIRYDCVDMIYVKLRYDCFVILMNSVSIKKNCGQPYKLFKKYFHLCLIF